MDDGKRGNTGSADGDLHAPTGTPSGAGRASRVWRMGPYYWRCRVTPAEGRALSWEILLGEPATCATVTQRKTDRIDSKKMVRALLAHDRGDAAVLSRVRVPGVEEEDRKRLIRERRCLVERTSLNNSIKGLLKLHGIFDLVPRTKDFEEKFADAGTAYGSPFPARARREIERLEERLSLIERQTRCHTAQQTRLTQREIQALHGNGSAHIRNSSPCASFEKTTVLCPRSTVTRPRLCRRSKL